MVHGGHWLSRAAQQQTVLVRGAARHAHVVGQALAVDLAGVVAGLVHQSGGRGGVATPSTAGSEAVRVSPGSVVVRQREGMVLGQLHWEVLQDWRLSHHMTTGSMEVVSIVEAEWSGSSPGVVGGRSHPSTVPVTAAPSGWAGLREHLTRLQYNSQSVSQTVQCTRYIYLHHYMLYCYILNVISYNLTTILLVNMFVNCVFSYHILDP